jgi:hypothetical protein
VAETEADPRVFVHSCLLPNSSTDVIQEILQQIHDSALIAELSHVFVLNYGADLTHQRAAFQQMLTLFPTSTAPATPPASRCPLSATYVPVYQ